MRIVSGLAVLTATLGSPASGQITATKLNPLDDWTVEHVDGLCTVTRKFGRSSAPTTLQLRNRDPWNGGFHVAISSEGYAITQRRFTAGWLPGGTFVTIDRPTYETTEAGTPSVVFEHGVWDNKRPDKGSPEYAEYWSRDEFGKSVGPLRFKRDVETFLVNGAFEQPLLFATGPMDKVTEARDACINEMLVSKGVDPAVEDRDDHLVEMVNIRELGGRIARRAPSSVRYTGNWGGVSFLVFVDGDAIPTSCNLVSLPYDKDYEEYGCRELTKNAKFRFKDGERAQPAFYKLHLRVG